MDLSHLFDTLPGHLTDLVPYLRFVTAAAATVPAVRRAIRAARAGARHLRRRRDRTRDTTDN
ncbi:hypothetical protein AB0O18_30265 [Streptomyces sp. NPDC093224]|uniref:hypothetical protein n=1 Tax=Streptomyces sp. NPDC093224 TaxID=3155198 RepID=UPI00343232F8